MVEINPRSGSIKPESQPKSRNLNIPSTGGKKKKERKEPMKETKGKNKNKKEEQLEKNQGSECHGCQWSRRTREDLGRPLK